MIYRKAFRGFTIVKGCLTIAPETPSLLPLVEDESLGAIRPETTAASMRDASGTAHARLFSISTIFAFAALPNSAGVFPP